MFYRPTNRSTSSAAEIHKNSQIKTKYWEKNNQFYDLKNKRKRKQPTTKSRQQVTHQNRDIRQDIKVTHTHTNT